MATPSLAPPIHPPNNSGGPSAAGAAGYALVGFFYGFLPLVLFSSLFAWLGGLTVAGVTYLAIRHQPTRLRVRRAALATWLAVARVAPFAVIGVALLSYFTRGRGGRGEVDSSMFSEADRRMLKGFSFLGFGFLLFLIAVVIVVLLMARTVLEAMAKGNAKDTANEEGGAE